MLRKKPVMEITEVAIDAIYFALRIRLGSTTHIVKSPPKATAPRIASISFLSCFVFLSLSVLQSSVLLNLNPIVKGFCFAIIAVMLTPCNILPVWFKVSGLHGLEVVFLTIPACSGIQDSLDIGL